MEIKYCIETSNDGKLILSNYYGQAQRL